MKYIAALLLLFVSASATAKDKGTPNPADYPITLHVVSSRLYDVCTSNCVWVQHIVVTMDGKKYELSDTEVRHDLLRLGDYKAKIIKDEQGHTFEYERDYEILFPNGETRKFVVVGESE
jgi:hypothetical protein